MAEKSARDAITSKMAAQRQMMEVQMNMKNNANQLADYCKDLEDWRKDIDKKDKSKSLRETPAGVSKENILEFLNFVYRIDVRQGCSS